MKDRFDLEKFFETPILGNKIKLHFMMFSEKVEMHNDKLSQDMQNLNINEKDSILEILTHLSQYSYLKGVGDGFRIIKNIEVGDED